MKHLKKNIKKGPLFDKARGLNIIISTVKEIISYSGHNVKLSGEPLKMIAILFSV